MRIAALILGILGGFFGLGGAMFAAMVGGAGKTLGAQGADTVIGLGAGATVFSVLGLIAGALALGYPRFSGWTMIICAVGGFISVSFGYILAGPLLLVAGILALVSAKKSGAQSQQAKAS